MSTDFLTELAEARPDPGGGAAAAYGARVALALLLKVVRLEQARPQRLEVPTRNWGDLADKVQEAADACSRLQQEDVRAYSGFTQAREADDPVRLATAVRTAVEVPRRIMQEVGGALELLAQVAQNCKRHLVSDLLVVCELLGGALRGAYHIAASNLAWRSVGSAREELAMEIAQTLQVAEAYYLQTRNVLLRRQEWR